MSRRLRILSTAISLIIAGSMPLSASAGGVYLLQLGSFGSRNEAQALWESLKGKYPELFSGFSARFQEVQLPPDNFVVFRTQAGALEDRADAQTVCDRLNSRGDECYVVETAMFRPDLMPEQSAELAVVNPATQQQVGSVKVPQPELPEDTGQMPQVETIAKIEPQLPVDKLPQPAVQAPNVEATAIGVAKPEVRTTIINPALKTTMPERPQVDLNSAQELAALPEVDAPKPFTVEVKPAPEAPEVAMPDVNVRPPQMQAPTMQAPAIQAPTISKPAIKAPSISAPSVSAPSINAPAVVAPSVAAPSMSIPSINPPTMSVEAPSFSPAPRMTPKPQEDDGESFWSMMDPFSDDDSLDGQAPMMQTVEVEDEEEGWFDGMFGSDDDEQDVNFPPAPQATQSIDPSPLDSNWGTGEVVAATPFTLPPPPSPNNDAAMAKVAQERIDANRRKTGVATPLTTEPFAQAPQTTQQAPVQTSPAIPAMPKPVLPALAGAPRSGQADVEVAEAIRVPLTQNQQPMMDLKPKYPTAGELKKLGKPSGDMKNQSVWAQIYHFESEQMALAYWEAFKAENPTFPTVRVRVTRPYDPTLSDGGKVSLRVGPFENARLITDVCAEVANDNISCKPMAEIGSTGIAQFDRKSYLPSRYEKAGAKEKFSSEPMYWVQLGSFDSEGTAKKEWSTLRTQYKPLLDGATANVASPIMSSAMQPVYRLRTGPYAMRTGADKLCAGMRAKGTECLVVFSR